MYSRGYAQNTMKIRYGYDAEVHHVEACPYPAPYSWSIRMYPWASWAEEGLVLLLSRGVIRGVGLSQRAGRANRWQQLVLGKALDVHRTARADEG